MAAAAAATSPSDRRKEGRKIVRGASGGGGGARANFLSPDNKDGNGGRKTARPEMGLERLRMFHLVKAKVNFDVHASWIHYHFAQGL